MQVEPTSFVSRQGATVSLFVANVKECSAGNEKRLTHSLSHKHSQNLYENAFGFSKSPYLKTAVLKPKPLSPLHPHLLKDKWDSCMPPLC